MSAAKATIRHDTIRRWVDERGGKPAHVKKTRRGDDPGILRIDFPGFSGEQTLEKLGWDEFFEWFDRNELAFLYQDEENSRFNKLVSRNNVELVDQEPGGRARSEGGLQLHAIKLLEQQHREIEALFDHFQRAEGDRARARAFEHVADRLAAHARIEEEIFYPEVFGDDIEGELREAVEEHLAVKRIIADLLEMEPSDPQFTAKMASMKELVEHHVKSEEEKLFAMLDDIEPETFVEMGGRMCELYRELMTESPRTAVPDETARAASL
jgi:hemerythrin superfamily protein